MKTRGAVQAFIAVSMLLAALSVGGAQGPDGDAAVVGLISDRAELEAITPILDDMGLTYDVVNHNWDGSQGVYTSDYGFLSNYSIVVWYASGDAFGRLITQEEHDALEAYLQAGGRLLATGYDTLGSPTDPLMADLVRSSSSGDGPFTTDYTITDADHPITDGPFGTFSAGTALVAYHSDHDQAEANTGRGAVTVAELSDGHDKIIATELASGGIVVYWNGNRNASDWSGTLSVLQEQQDDKEPRRDAEGGLIGSLTIEHLREWARRVEPGDVPPEANYGGTDPVWHVPPEILSRVQAEAVPQGSQSVAFPATGDTISIAFDPNWWRDGDYAQGNRTLGLTSVSRVVYSLSISDNVLNGTGHVDLGLYINGYLVGSLIVLPGESSRSVDFSFPPINGPVYTIRLEETNTVDPSAGSIEIPMDTSTMTFHGSSTPEHVAMLRNTLSWMMHPLPLPFFDDIESGRNLWVTDGLWHQVEDGVSPYPNSHSPTHSWWYGQDATGDYDTGGANSGNLTSPPVEIPPGIQATLSFWQWYETEPNWPNTTYFDVHHDADGNDNISGGIYTDWANDLTAGGHTVVEHNQPISLATLSGYGALALFDPEIALSAGEITAINDFMLNGGRVVVLGEWSDMQGVNTVLNALTIPHGITLNSDTVQDPTNNDGGNAAWPLINSFAEDGMVAGINTVVLYAGASLSLSGSAVPLASGDGDTSATSITSAAEMDADEHALGEASFVVPEAIIPGAPAVMAYVPVGTGQLIAIGDSGLWGNEDPDADGIVALDEYDNRELSHQIFAFRDERWVQISVDDGPFQNLLQVIGGPMNAWHQTSVDLSAYAGSTVRVCFRFVTLDGTSNGFRGWYIDDVALRRLQVFLPIVLRNQ